MSNTTITTNSQPFSAAVEQTKDKKGEAIQSENHMTDQTALTIEDLNKKISRTIRFKDRMAYLNKSFREGKTEKDMQMSVFEIELRARQGNHKLLKKKDGRTLKLFSRDLLDRSTTKIRHMCRQKNELIQLSNMGMA